MFRKALKMKPDSDEAMAGLGIALVNSGEKESDFREAVKLLRAATKAQDRNARAWLALGMAQQFTGERSQAVTAYKKYLALEPNGSSAGDVKMMLRELE